MVGSTSARRTVRWVVLIAVAALAGVVVAAAILDVASMRYLGVVNTGPADLRVSGCVDDALDLSAGQWSKVEVPRSARIGCVVFLDQQYAGCLVLQSREVSPVDILARLDRRISRGGCDKIG